MRFARKGEIEESVSEESTPEVKVRLALTGCVNCGLVLEAETEISAGQLTSDGCPDCGQRLRVVDLAEANQLTQERFLASHWREIAAARSAGRHG